MKLTWILWHALASPPRHHPIFRLTQKLLTPRPRVYRGCWRVLYWLFRLTVVVVGLWIAVAFIVALPNIIAVVIRIIVGRYSIFLLLVVPMSSFFAGAGLVKRVSTLLHQMRIQHTYDLFSLAPFGELILCWLVCVGTLHFNKYFVHAMRFVRVSFVVMCAMLALNLGVLIGVETWMAGVYIFTVTLVIMFGLYLDYIQTVILSGLLGMLASTFMGDSPNQYDWGNALYLMLQGGVYTITILLGVVAFNLVQESMGVEQSLFFLPFQLLLLFGLALVSREGFIRLVWRILVRRCAALSEDLEHIRRIA